MDYDKILDEELLRLQIQRAIIKTTSINEQTDAELSKKFYRRILRPIQEYASIANRKIARMKL